MKKASALFMAGGFLLVTLAGLFFTGGKVAASGEIYTLTFVNGKPSVSVTGGELKGTTTLSYTGSQSVFGLPEDVVKGTVTYAPSNCTFDLSIGVTGADITSGTVLDASGGTCPSTVTQKYSLDSPVPLGGALAKSTLIFWNDEAPDQSKTTAQETITLKLMDGTVIGTDTQSPLPGASNISYQGKFDNPNGLGDYDFQACSALWKINPCQQFHKTAGATLSIMVGNAVLTCPTGQVLNATGQCDTAPETCTNLDANGNCINPDGTLNCNSGTLNWLICPVITIAAKAANVLDGIIMSTLDVDVAPIFDNTNVPGPSKGYYTAWNSFRIIAVALMTIAGIAMVAAQAFGFEFLDAYTIRKVLPRLLIAIIGISLSWQLMRLAVSFFDTVGFDIRTLMYAPFKALGGTINIGVGVLTTLGVGALIFLNPASLTFILTALLAAFVGFVILVLRQVAIIMLIIVAPVAIACYVLPNTQKVWKLWIDNFLGLMLMFPIISALIAAGHIFSAVALRSGGGGGFASTLVAQALGIIAYFIPYFLLPLAARLATGVIGNLAGFVNNSGKGLFDRMKKYRAEQGALRRERRGRIWNARRADWSSRMLKSSDNKGFVRRNALYWGSRAVGGHNAAASSSARNAAVQKEINDQIQTGDDTEPRALTAFQDATSSTGWRSLGGREIEYAYVRRARARWGRDPYAMQAALSYEMRKASSEEEIKTLTENYGKVAQQWGMSDSMATSTWVGAAFANQNAHLEYKQMRFDGGQNKGVAGGAKMVMNQQNAGYQKFVGEIYEARGSYNLAQMGSNTIRELENAYTLAVNTGDVKMQEQVQGIAEMFMSRYGSGVAGGADEETLKIQQAQQQAQQGQQGPMQGNYQTNTPGSAHTAERVRRFAFNVGVYRPDMPPQPKAPSPGPMPTIPPQN
ncbi:MAG TPA: hypothetical protein VLF40_02280 [Candidatus Saccharimonadales bacterium]|nr:hypothetical protein [Candidatus Saccharimonadales bacterium]